MKCSLFKKMRGTWIGITVFSLLGCAIDTSNNSSIVKKWIHDGALIVDVRTPEEFNAGNYKNSINIPLSDIEKNIEVFGDKNRPIIVYCRSGRRSGEARRILEKHKYNKILNAGAFSNMPE